MDVPANNSFLPDLCSTRAVLVVVVVAELMALVVTLVATYYDDFSVGRLAITSLFVQWVGLSSAALICQLRNRLNRLPPAWTSTVVVLLVVAEWFDVLRWGGVLYLVYLGIGQWRAGGDGFFGIGDGRQLLIIDFDQFCRIFCLGIGLSDNNSDLIADMADLALSQGRVERLVHWAAVFIVHAPAARDGPNLHILAREDRDNARGSFCRCGINALDLGMGMRAAQDVRVGLIGLIDVVRIIAASG